jgi:class 3 adenylate cyclase/nitrite reductase/ring-hydroxylating ferredoxin subunit
MDAQSEPGMHGAAERPIRLRSAPDGIEFDCQPGASVLEAALQAGLPMAHACGGKARCSTCRIWIDDTDHAGEPPPTEAEAALKRQLALGPQIRLACQFRPIRPLAFRRLVIDQSDLAVANQLDRSRAAQAGEVRNVAVMFFDVSGFTAISDRLPPYDVMFLLNKFLTHAASILERHGGYFDKAIGDGFVAIFGVQGQSDSPLRAVAAALEVLRAVDGARPLMRQLYGVEFNARIGLHYGEALIGALGPAGDERLTVIGDVANIASRAEQANKEAGTRLLITEDLYAQVLNAVVSPDFVRMRVAGTKTRRTFYEVAGLTAEAQAWVDDPANAPLSHAPGKRWERLLDSAALPEGAVRIVPQRRYDIALTRRGGRVFAFNNHCPHNRLALFGQELPEGGPLPPAPADSAFPTDTQVECRFHGSVFDLENGRIVSWCPRLGPDGAAEGLSILGDISKNEACLEVFRCREADGGILVELE